MGAILDAALRAAKKGGACILAGWDRIHEIQYKGAIDLVTETDIEAQRAIVSEIREAFPHHSILAEEEGLDVDKGSDRWIVDPLDGTTNFAHRFPFVSVSIAYRKHDVTEVGVVYNPILDELFWAERGGGAYVNGTRMQVSGLKELRRSLIATGFPYDIDTMRTDILGHLDAMLSASQGVRRPGSAAIDLAYVARGVFDGFWEQGLKPWDIAAGALLVEQAGGAVTNFHNEPLDLYEGQILASNGRIHNQMVTVLTGQRSLVGDEAAVQGRRT